jgi:hypothetical protein
MAEPNLIQRGLTGFRETVKQLRQPEGQDAGGRVGRGGAGGGAKKTGKAKGGLLGKLGRALGFSTVDAYNEDFEEQQRRKKARAFFGDDEPSFVGVRGTEAKRDLSSVSPEFRDQVSTGLSAANTMTTGTTLVEDSFAREK